MTADSPVPTTPDDPTDPVVPAEVAALSAADLGAEIEPDLEAIAAAQRAMRLVELVRLEPELAAALGAAAEDPESLTPIEQEPLEHERALDEVLATTMWPAEVAGAALVLERVVLPPSAEDALADDNPEAVEQAAAEHPERQDVRMAVLVTRDGGRICAVRLRSHDVDDEVLVGEDIVPRLADALAATLS